MAGNKGAAIRKSLLAVVAPCTCVHEGQDVLHGRGRRVHNLSGKIADRMRCTVCSKMVDVPKRG